MDTRGLRRFAALRRIGIVACAVVLAGCAVPGTSVHYGHVVSDPGVYYDPVPVAPAPYYGPPVYYGAPAIVAPAPIIIDRPVYSPRYRAPVYRGHHHRYRVDPPRRHPPGAHGPGFRGDRGGRPRHDARPSGQPHASPGIRSSGRAGAPQFGGFGAPSGIRSSGGPRSSQGGGPRRPVPDSGP